MSIDPNTLDSVKEVSAKQLAYILENVSVGSGDPKTVTKVIDLASLLAGAESALSDCAAIDLHTSQNALAITVACTYNVAAVAGIKVHVRTSYDGASYDTEDWDAWTPTFTAGAKIQQTKVYDTSPAYLKVLIENTDPAQPATGITVQSTVRGG